jgi:hypothetical protein
MSEWQDIKTAPLGVWCLGFFPKMPVKVLSFEKRESYRDGKLFFSVFGIGELYPSVDALLLPSHWQHQPAPPTPSYSSE